MISYRRAAFARSSISLVDLERVAELGSVLAAVALFGSASRERTVLLIICGLSALSAFGIASVEPFFTVGLVGWILAAWQTIRHHQLATDPDEAVRGQVFDLTFTMLITLLWASVIYSLFVYYGSIREARPWEGVTFSFSDYQAIAFGIFVQVGGWLVAWIQGVRRIRLNQARAAAGHIRHSRRRSK